MPLWFIYDLKCWRFSLFVYCKWRLYQIPVSSKHKDKQFLLYDSRLADLLLYLTFILDLLS